jgi:glycine/D-amino acid oxidase-like deaminating enzyme/nitrite reductase/ring-hydroxylating ferredoxin subunit
MATSPSPDLPVLPGDARADAVVVGAGLTGLTVARLLVEEGLAVTVVDSGEVCAGVTGNTTAKVTALQSSVYSRLSRDWGDGVAAEYAGANLEGLSLIRRLADLGDIDCDLRTDSAYTYAETEEGLSDVEEETEAAQRAGLDVVLTTDTDLPFPVRGAVRLDGQARFHPRKYCLGLLQAILARGGSVFESTRALDLDSSAGKVHTDRGTVTADRIFVASHVPFVDTGLYMARMTASRSYAVAFQSPSRAGMYISVEEPIRSIRSTEDGHLIVGGAGHPVGERADTRDHYEALESWSAERFGATRIDHRWSAQDYRSADGLPYVGPLGRSGRVFMATGFAKWGMANGSVAAAVMVDLAMGRDSRWSELFDTRRIALKQAAPDLVEANARTVKNLVTKRVLSSEVGELAALAPGTGDVVSYDGGKAAAFRDEGGLLHAVSPVCTHLGCQVEFNNAERSWDCPCHGSRFDLEGKVIHGPAVKDLDEIGLGEVSPSGR